MKNIISLEIIDLIHTDEELQQNEIAKNMMQRFLKNVTEFLDEEERLGFLSQKNVDRIVIVEDMLREELQKAKQPAKQKEQEKTTKTHVFCDNDGGMDCELSIRHHTKDEGMEL